MAFLVQSCHLFFPTADWFAALSHEFVENKQLDHESTINFILFDKHFSIVIS